MKKQLERHGWKVDFSVFRMEHCGKSSAITRKRPVSVPGANHWGALQKGGQGDSGVGKKRVRITERNLDSILEKKNTTIIWQTQDEVGIVKVLHGQALEGIHFRLRSMFFPERETPVDRTDG